MADPIYINISDAAEGADLARAICRHGLSAGLVRSDTRWQVEISSPREDPAPSLPMSEWHWRPGTEVDELAVRVEDLRNDGSRSTAARFHDPPDQGGDRKVYAVEPLGTVLALASATLLMVLAGVSKSHLVWQRRRYFFRRRR